MTEKKKSFMIKPFRPNVAMNVAQANKTWDALSTAIKEIHNQNASSLSFEELYRFRALSMEVFSRSRNAYSLVLHKHGDILYNGVVEAVTGHLRGINKAVIDSSDGQLLSVLSEKWTHHTVTMMIDYSSHTIS